MYINPIGNLSKYLQLSDILRTKIEDGEWKPYQPIPAQRDLAVMYNVSMTTVRQSLDLLTKEGFIYRIQGSGTFVAARIKMQHRLHTLESFTNDMGARGFKVGQKILGFSYVEPPMRARQLLELPPNIDQVLRVERLRFCNDQPMGIHTSYLLLSPGQKFTQEELETTGSLYTLLTNKFNLVPIEADEIIEATTASDREAKLLNIKKGSSLLILERITWSYERYPMEYVNMHHRADLYKCYVHLSAKGVG
jgi:GntR family transcriptional regulator